MKSMRTYKDLSFFFFLNCIQGSFVEGYPWIWAKEQLHLANLFKVIVVNDATYLAENMARIIEIRMA